MCQSCVLDMEKVAETVDLEFKSHEDEDELET
jgi:hypothetical protein